MTPDEESVKRLLEYQIKGLSTENDKLHGELATARGHVGRIERELRENSARLAVLRRALAEAPSNQQPRKDRAR